MVERSEEVSGMRAAPNKSLQRTRMCAPLSSKPLGVRSCILTIVFSVCVAGCESGGPLARQVAVEARRDGAIIRLSGITSFRWDRFCAFGPYTTQGQADSCLGFDWRDFKATGLEMDDTFSLMVFANGNRVVHAEKISRRVDFSYSVQARPFTPETAIFRVIRAASGR